MSEATSKWTWNSNENPNVISSIMGPATDLSWCDQLENSPSDTIVGKVLCVCAASRIARELTQKCNGRHELVDDALDLLDLWIDEPTDERFDSICSLIFGDSDPLKDHVVVWWALRTATSSVGNYEAGWALGSLCENAITEGSNPEKLRALAQHAIETRMSFTVS